MNYHRRTTRPDGMHYRETRKIRGAARPGGRRGGGGLGAVALFMIVALVAAGVWWVWFR